MSAGNLVGYTQVTFLLSHYCNPPEHFTISELHNQVINASVLHKIRRSPDFEVLNL